MLRSIVSWRALPAFVLLSAAAAQARAQEETPLPRWREGGTPYDEEQSLVPFSVKIAAPTSSFAPTAGILSSPPEYEPVRGVLFRYSSTSFASVVRDCVVALTADPAYDDIAYVVVSNATQQANATSAFVAGGADMSKVQFIVHPTDSIWMRDYGPHFVWQDGALVVVDSHYYPTRPNDNFVPTLLGDDTFGMPTYDMGLYYSGGNFQPGPARSGFATALVNLDNPSGAGFTPASIAELYTQFQGIDVLHVLPQLPPSVDGTGHIDMWMYLVDADTAIVSEFQPGSNATAISITNNAVPFMEGLGFDVLRTPAFNVGSTHYTYANAFRVNQRIFVPSYGQGNAAYLDEDAAALAAWQAAAGPGVQIVPINCFSIIPAAGAIHCIVKQVPRYVAPAPSAHVVAPDGGELLVPGTTTTIAWAATDTNNVALASAELSWSPNDGVTWLPITTVANTGSYVWTVPAVATERARVRVEVVAQDGDRDAAVSAATFRIVPAQRTTYDTSSGAGVTRFVFGAQSASWNAAVSGVRLPVATEISSAAYAALASSNATGGDADANRYVSPNPSTGFESTHVYEVSIGESPAAIASIEASWEGYADNCTQAELYVWDYVAAQWGDGRGLTGQNRFADSFAGNRDGLLSCVIQTDVARYVGAGGQMTFLVYAERPNDETFHDYLALRVTTSDVIGTSSCSGDGSATACPCGNVGDAGRGCANSSASVGARLAAFGGASVAIDTVSLSAESVPPSAAVLFIQGSAQQNGGAGVVFGDGLRCVSGAVVRLGVRNAVGGAAGYGVARGDEPISQRGAIGPAGGTFHYQAWYRDPANFCTSSTFNLSNAVSVVWAP